ncbi:MFS transporter [Actinomadura kijaniata]|uniref:CP family cyanate transporter-like MFS transporter n=1 Tax=Actinomadura namibiensis TaxID=182080 RepID=A0A7W3LWG3_ACTNM|nr:MFS transporter [Actinomadura namibiensis]MBA8955591.1 CP family cyanate transporter-like MFS transporter [Actinomadura namibiensis]
MSERRRHLLGLALIVLVALNLRPAITAVGPLLTEIRGDFGLSGTAAGALTTLPLVCFGAYGLLAPFLRRPPRSETLLVTGMTLLVAALLLRLLDAPAALFAGSLVAGVAISIGNIAMPAIIKRDHPAAIPAVTALYSVAVTVGAAASSGFAVPVEKLLDGTWRLPLALLAVPAALAALAWLPALLRARRGDRRPGMDRSTTVARPGSEVRRAVWTSKLAWQVTAFMGTQSLLAYVVIGWLPTIAQDRGLDEASAGYVLALSSLMQAVGSLAVPVVARRFADQRPLVAAVVALSVVGFVGIGWAPVATVWGWAVVLGLAQGAGFAAALAFLGMRAHDAQIAAQLSGMAQGVGYVIAALGPLAIGALHDATHGWTVPLAVTTAIAVWLLLPGLAVGRDRAVGAPAPAPEEPAPRART